MKRIFDPTRIGTLQLKNRLMRSAMWMNGAEEDGHLNEFILNTYEELARGGVGLIMTGYASISADEKPLPRMLGIYDDSFIPEYTQLTNRIHQHGSRVALQLVYGGSQSHHEDAATMKILAPSAIQNRVTALKPKEASRAEIQQVISQFADAAERAKQAGFDAVQLHAVHGYFLSSFLTPLYNQRSDEYNGSIHDRARIIYDTFREVRARVGEDFPILIKLNFDDFMDDGEGLVFDDALEVFKKLDELGCTLFEVSATNESSGKGLAPARTKLFAKEKQSYFSEATAQIADAVSAPVILMGGNRAPDTLNDLLNSTAIDYFSIARPLLSEPDLVNRWQADAHYKPRCVSCNRCWESAPNRCVLNKT